MPELDLLKRIYMNRVEAVNERGQPPVKWVDRMPEYVRGLENARTEINGGSSAMTIPCGEF